jgi:ERCC4-type nuclease
MSAKAVQGTLIHLSVFLGIPVICSLNIQETAFLLVDICNQSRLREMPVVKPIITSSPNIRINKKQKQKLAFLQNLPGIGIKKAIALFSAFNTIVNIINASPSALVKARGIGNKLVDRMYKILHEPFKI